MANGPFASLQLCAGVEGPREVHRKQGLGRGGCTQEPDSPVLLSPKSIGQEMVKDRTQTMAIMTVTLRLEL